MDESRKDEHMPIIFMNKPISEAEEDVIGFSTIVKNLKAAIDGGAQMIGLTSPFGTGKTSVTELLEKEYAENKKIKVIRVPMWSHISEENRKKEGDKGNATPLHQNFVYQLVSQINPRQGEYISKRLNPSYGLLNFSILGTIPRILMWIAIFLFIFSYVLPVAFGITYVFMGENADTINKSLMVLALLLFAIGLSRSELVFSSDKSEGGRKIETNEIIQIYREKLLRYRRRIFRKCSGKHYIVIVEDLDRTNNDAAVIEFLEELRKYYIPENMEPESGFYLNRVSFIVTVKPEPLMKMKNSGGTENNAEDKISVRERLYDKLFDYTLNLQRVNVDNYQAILDGVLDKKKALISQLGLMKEREKAGQIAGMPWIIHGTYLGIREIKERLNRAFSLYESLRSRFGEKSISFEKCAVVAYVTTEFEDDFYKTPDTDFQTLVEWCLRGKPESAYPQNVLSATSEEYRRTIRELVEARHIDEYYRMYFYNYPKDSRVYTPDEEAVRNAIVRGGDYTDELPHQLEKALESDLAIVRDALQERRRLKLALPEVVFEFENLYIQALRHDWSGVQIWMKSLAYDLASSPKTVDRILRVLDFDISRNVYDERKAAVFCAIWEGKFDEKTLTQLRKRLCEKYPKETPWYKQLFFGVHSLITTEEIENLLLADVLSLVNIENDLFSISTVNCVSQKFVEAEDGAVAACKESMSALLENAQEYIVATDIAWPLMTYMSRVQEIKPEFEKTVVESIREIGGEAGEELFSAYQQLVNSVAPKGLTPRTLENISELDRYDGYVDEVADQLDDGIHTLDFVLLRMCQERAIPFEREDVARVINKKLRWLEEDKQFLIPLRRLMTRHEKCVLEMYAFMFGKNCPVVTAGELASVGEYRLPEKEVLKLIPTGLITDAEIPMLKAFFNRKKHLQTDSYEILCYIARLDATIAKKLFFELDFEMICYRRISAARKASIKARLYNILSLDEPDERIRFMMATGYLDAVWEEELPEEIAEDSELLTTYADTVNSVGALSKSTLRVLMELPPCSMSEEICEQFYENGAYLHYVVGKTEKLQCFVFENNERDQILWTTYVGIFSSNDYKKTRDYMRANKTFLEAVVQSKDYEDMNDDNVLPLADVRQTKALIENIFERNEAFVLEYMLHIDGFRDKEAASVFVEYVLSRETFLRSQELYDHTYEKLVDVTLKSRYTRARNKREMVVV